MYIKQKRYWVDKAENCREGIINLPRGLISRGLEVDGRS